MWRVTIGDFYVKPVKISGFSILAYVCSCLLMCAHLLFIVTIEGIIMLKKHVEDQKRGFEVKPVKISGFSILAHACSCLLMCAHLLFFVTIEGLMMSN